MVTAYNRERPQPRGKRRGEPTRPKREQVFFMRRIALVYGVIKRALPFVCLFLSAVGGEAQIQVDLKFKRLQYIAYEPVVATLSITTLAGRDVDLHDADGQSWFGFEVTGNESQPIPAIPPNSAQPPLQIKA